MTNLTYRPSKVFRTKLLDQHVVLLDKHVDRYRKRADHGERKHEIGTEIEKRERAEVCQVAVWMKWKFDLAMLEYLCL